jgi:hypothetical protein
MAPVSAFPHGRAQSVATPDRPDFKALAAGLPTKHEGTCGRSGVKIPKQAKYLCSGYSLNMQCYPSVGFVAE